MTHDAIKAAGTQVNDALGIDPGRLSDDAVAKADAAVADGPVDTPRAAQQAQQHVATFAAAYATTGDDRFALAARTAIEAYIAHNPTRDDWKPRPGDTQLTTTGRIGRLQMHGWTVALPALLKHPAFDDAFLTTVLDSIVCQINWSIDVIPPSINWRIAAADCIMLTALRLPHLPDAPRWRAFGVAVINDAYHRQFLPDGAHYERTPNYHTWMTYCLTDCWRLNRAMPELGFKFDTRQLMRMWDYALSTTRPNGSFNAMNDNMSVRTGPYVKGHWKYAVRADRQRFRDELGMDDALPPATGFFPDAGHALLRSDWSEDATYVTFDATRDGGGHCHLSRNSVQLHAHGRTIVPDPGVRNYDASDPRMAYMKTTRAHSTCNLDGRNQSLASPTRTTMQSAPGAHLVRSDYEGGYWHATYGFGFAHAGDAIMASHCRIMLWLHDVGLVVIDSIFRTPTKPNETEADMPSFECNWQLCDGAQVSIDEAAGCVVSFHGDSNLLLLVPQRPSDATIMLHEGEMDPPRGWLPTQAGYVPGPQVCIRQPVMREHGSHITSVLLPYTTDEPPVFTATFENTAFDRFNQLTLTHPDGRVDEVHWTYRMDILLGRQPDYETDAGLVHLRRDAAGTMECVTAFGGTYLKPWSPDELAMPGVLAGG